MTKHMKDRYPEVDMSDPLNRVAEKFFKMRVHKRYTLAMDRPSWGRHSTINIARREGWTRRGSGTPRTNTLDVSSQRWR